MVSLQLLHWRAADVIAVANTVAEVALRLVMPRKMVFYTVMF